MRLLLGLAAVLVLAGCGSAAVGPGKPASAGAAAAPAPPVVPVDEAPPEEIDRVLAEEFAPPPADSTGVGALQTTVTFAWGGTTTTTTAPTPAQLAEARAQFEAERQELRPAPGSAPRVVARLPLADGGEVLFVVWHNRDGRLCTYTNATDASGSGGGGMGGSCGLDPQATQCAAICLVSDGTGMGAAEDWVLTGTVAADADALDVTTADGSTTEYPLSGPVLDGDRRVFLLDLGGQDWRKLALVRGGDVVAATAMPAASVAGEECQRKAGPMPAPAPTATSPPTAQSAATKAWRDAFQACLEASGAFPVTPAVTTTGP